MTAQQIAAAVLNAYYLGWNQLTDTQKATQYGDAAQSAASIGDFATAAALVLAATVTVRSNA